MQNSVVSDIAQTPPHEPNLPIELSQFYRWGNMNIRPRPASVLQRLGEGIFIRTRLVYTAYPLYAGPRAPATCALCCDCVLSLAVARARAGAPHSGAPLSI